MPAKKIILLSTVLLIGAFLLRTVNLSSGLPVFADEAIYIRWAQVMRADETLRFLPLSDGKQPLYMWVMIPFLKIINNPLTAGRLLSVLSGVVTCLGIAIISFLLFKSPKITLAALLVSAICPFLVFFDRKALADSFLNMWGVLAVLLAVYLVEMPSLGIGMLLGFVLGGGWLTKSPGIFFFVFSPLAFVTGKISNFKKSHYVLKTCGYFIVALVIGTALYNILRLGPNFHMIAQRNADYVIPLSEVVKHPLDPLLINLRLVCEWLITLFPLPMLIASLFGLFLVIRDKKYKLAFYLVAWFLVPVIYEAAFARVFTARYILFTLPPLIILAAFSIKFIKPWSAMAKIIFTLIVSLTLIQTGYLVLFPKLAILPRTERSGYLEEWTAGYGLAEIADYLKALPASQHILVGTEGYFGTTPDGLQIYLEGRKNIRVIGLPYPIKEVPGQLASAIYDNDVFLVANSSRFAITDPQRVGLVKIGEYSKPAKPDGTSDSFLFFRLQK